MATVNIFSLTGTDAATNLSDIVTVITNTSGKTLPFGFIPPHGKELINGETITIQGDLQAQLMCGGGRQNKRKADALQRAFENRLIRYSTHERKIVYCPVDSSIVININDLVWYDTNDVKPANEFTWDTNIATTQASFANAFLGVALDSHGAGAVVTNFPVDMSPLSIYARVCTSEAHEIGDTFGPAKHPSQDKLLNQNLVKATAASSIARAVKRDADATTTAIVRFQSAFFGQNIAGNQ